MRKFICTLSIAVLAVFAAGAQAGPFFLPKLNYAFNALEPSIDAQTMEIHYSKHHAAYVANLNKAVAGTALEKKSLEELLTGISKTNAAVRNNAGGHYNHSLFWDILAPQGNNSCAPESPLGKACIEQFGSFEALWQQLKDAASSRFGSGWAWLSVTPEGRLSVSSTANQDNPLMDTETNRGIPILGIDVWEHAYYLKYQNKRADYLDQLWKVVNWKSVNERYVQAIADKDLLMLLKK